MNGKSIWEDAIDNKFSSSDVENAFKALDMIKSAKGRNDKKSLLAKNESDVMKLICWLTYNTYLNFWLREIDSEHSEKASGYENFTEFVTLLKTLSDREITGNAARKEINKFFSKCSKQEFSWYSAIFYRDLDIGINVKTINAIYQDLIPLFEVQLASKYDGKCTFEKNRYVVEPKMDGLRAIIFTDKNGQAVDIFSRRGKTLYNVDAILKAVSKLGLKSVAIDCELMSDDWNNSISIAHSQDKHENSDSLKAHIFDCVPLEDFQKGVCRVPLIERTKDIRKALEETPSKYLIRVPRYKVSSPEDISKRLSESINAGFEGLILKDVNAFYESKRSASWQKIKLEQTYDSEIRDIEISKSFDNKNIVLLDKNEDVSKYEKNFNVVHGSVKIKDCASIIKELCETEVITPTVMKTALNKLPDFVGHIDIPMIKNMKVKVLKKEVSVGSGFTFAERIAFALVKDSLVGKIIEFKGQADPKAVTDGVRFPVFVKFRPDKVNESID